MLILQFSTSHYCRKARLGLGYKRLEYQVKNLTPGLHALKLKPLTGMTTMPVLLPQQPGYPEAVSDSTRIFHFLDRYQPERALGLIDAKQNAEVWAIEDWFDESIGVAARFVYYDFRTGEGKQVDPSLSSQAMIRVVRWQYGINQVSVELARERLEGAIAFLSHRWSYQGAAVEKYLVGDRLTAADLTAAALLSPLALIPTYCQQYPWLFDRIRQIHELCQEPLPPGLL
ncbi:MAG: glutathione S-transferase N-terminal domain-containing protein [Timaviella obliquedivisa GSE-PSE-MK23-08B]|jgi:glutathione S-transferase|nr:glutathione S-transferase N-terminal domain-containing protein [Timaviella obliquedivisa GSE-PSE-MK23-08B]